MKTTGLKHAITRAALPLVVYGGLALFMTSTNPRRLPLPLLIIPFALIFVGIYLPFKGFITSFVRGFRGGEPSAEAIRRFRFIAFMAALLPTFLLILSSINQLTVKDFLLSFILLAGLVFYINRSRLISR